MRLPAALVAVFTRLALLVACPAALAQPLSNPWPAGYTSLPAGMTSAPSCTAADSSNVYCFVVGAEGMLWARTLVDNDPSAAVGRWNDGWIPIGGSLQQKRPSCHAQGALQVDCMVVGQDQALWRVFYRSQTGWQFQSLGGSLASAPSCVQKASGGLECFVIGGDGRVYGKSMSWDNWSAWTAVAGPVSFYRYGGELSCFDDAGSSVCAAKRIDGIALVDLFVASSAFSSYAAKSGASSSGYITSWGSLNDSGALGGGSTGWPRRFLSSPACSSVGGDITCFIVGEDSQLYKWNSRSAKTTLVPGTAGLAGAPPSCTWITNDQVGCYLVAPNGIKYFGWVKAGAVAGTPRWVAVSPTASQPEAPSCVARGPRLDCVSRRLDDVGLTHFGWR